MVLFEVKASRCVHCQLPHDFCYCQNIEQSTSQFPIDLVIHSSEWRKMSNSGRVLTRSMEKSRLHIHGLLNHTLQAKSIFREGYQPVLLYPGAHATLTAEQRARIQLVVVDGNWGQASRMVRRLPFLRSLPRFSIEPKAPSQYLLRHHPDPTRLATLEAAAMALEQLGEGQAANLCRRNFRRLVLSNLAARGKMTRAHYRSLMAQVPRIVN